MAIENKLHIKLTAMLNPQEKTNVEKFKEVTDQMVKTFDAKNHDYGNAFEEGCDKFGIVSAVSRIDEKNSRVCTLYENAAISKVNESLEDTLLDMANYCVMLVMYLRDHKA